MQIFKCLLVSFFIFLNLCPTRVVAEEKKPSGPKVKMSNARVCYESGASIFGEITTFKPFESMEECIKAGGRLASGAKSSSEAEAKVEEEGGSGDTKNQNASKEKAQENRLPQQL